MASTAAARPRAPIAALTTSLTVGRLREALAGDDTLDWLPRPALEAAAPLPAYARGGLRLPPRVRPLGRAEVDKLVADLPANPLLARRRAELDLLSETALLRLGQLGRGSVEPGRAADGDGRVDWRLRWGYRWITAPRAQGWCENGWAFAAVALIEAMARIEHRVWARLSEGDLRDGWAAERGQARHDWLASWRASVYDALAWAGAHGVADAGTRELGFADTPYQPAPDRAGRVVRFGEIHAVAGAPAIRRWLDVVGPLVVGFEPHEDFGAYGRGVYRPVPIARPLGHHDVLLVGYDDEAACWIVKNSWGRSWGEDGFARIGYDCCQLGRWPAIGVRHVDLGAQVRRPLHAGALAQTGHAADRHDLWTVGSGWRPAVLGRVSGAGDADPLGSPDAGYGDPDTPWEVASWLGEINEVDSGRAALGHPTLAETPAGDGFEAVCWEFSGRLRRWRGAHGARRWRDLGLIGPVDASGWPGLARDPAAGGVLDLLVRTADGQLAHWRHDEAAGWREDARFGAAILASGPALAYVPTGVGSGAGATLDAVCVGGGGRLEHWRRAVGGGASWRRLSVFGQRVGRTPPCLIVSELGRQTEDEVGPMELLVAVRGRVQHWRRSGRHGGWRQVAAFGGWARHVWGLVYSRLGCLEALVERVDGGLRHYVLDTYGWHERGPVVG